MASKMAAKEERFYCGFFSYINISEIFMSEICFNCNKCMFLYKKCNFKIISTVNLSMASKMAAKMKNPIFGDILQFSLKIIAFLLLVVFYIIDDVSCQGTVHNQGRTGYIHSTKTKNNECMLGTTCLESKAADVS